MASSLFWLPEIKNAHKLSGKLRVILSMNFGLLINVILTKKDIPYLTGILHTFRYDTNHDASTKWLVDEIELLIRAINSYDKIKLWEEL